MNKYRQKLKEWYDKTADRYDTWCEREGEFNSESTSIEIKKFNVLLDKIDITPDFKILDIAAGTGNYLIEALKHGGEGYGIDISENMLKVLKNKNIKAIKEIKIGDASKLDFDSNFFDLIICIGLFDYYDFKDIKIFLNEMQRVAKKECKFIVDFPNINNKKTFEFQEKERAVGHEVYIHKPEEIDKFLINLGFNILAKHEAGIEVQYLIDSLHSK